MTYLIIEDIAIKKGNDVIKLKKGRQVRLSEIVAQKLITIGKVCLEEKTELRITGYELSERMAIMGENCEPNQTEPFITDSNILVISFNSDKKYHYWSKGQDVCTTLKELGRCDLIEKYKSNYSN